MSTIIVICDHDHNIHTGEFYALKRDTPLEIPATDARWILANVKGTREVPRPKGYRSRDRHPNITVIDSTPIDVPPSGAA